MTTPAQTPAPRLDPTRRLARRVMPFIAADSALLPTDRWIVSTLRDVFKTTPPLRRDMRSAVKTAVLGAGALVLGVVGVAGFAVGPLTVFGAGALVAVSAIGVMQTVTNSKTLLHRLKTESLPAIKDALTARYAQYKIDEIARAWKERLAAQQAAKAQAQAHSPVPQAPVQTAPAGLTTKTLRGLFGRKTSQDTQVPPAPKGKPPQP